MRDNSIPIDQYLETLRIQGITPQKQVEEIKQAIEEVNDELSGNGRLLVRPSGTEPLIRVMAEAETDEICERVVNRVADIVRRKFGAEN